MTEDAKMPDDAKTPTAEAAPLYSQSFFSKEMRTGRRLLFPTFVLPLLYTSLLMWACLSIYWGSLIPGDNITKLTVMAVDLDRGFLGDKVVQGIHAHMKQTPNHLNWVFNDLIKSDDHSKALLLDERAWAVLQVSTSASSSLDGALRSGDGTYNPLDAVTIYVTTGRNQITTNSHVIPSILAVLSPLLNEAGANHTAQFLASVAPDSDGLRTALRCPQGLASPFASKQVDLRPFNSNAASGSTMVGLIFLLTFTFSIFQILHTVGVVIGEKLNLKSAILFRTFNSLLAYFVISLWYTLINLAFGVPMTRIFGKSGVLIYWMLNMCTMAAVGLPMESLFTLIGLKWAGYFLSFWIIINVSSSFTSFELMPGFFKYGYGFPFFNSIQGVRTILFGTKNHLRTNFGVLIAWMVLGFVGMAGFTAWTLRRNARTGKHALP